MEVFVPAIDEGLTDRPVQLLNELLVHAKHKGLMRVEGIRDEAELGDGHLDAFHEVPDVLDVLQRRTQLPDQGYCIVWRQRLDLLVQNICVILQHPVFGLLKVYQVSLRLLDAGVERIGLNGVVKPDVDDLVKKV